MMDAARRFPRFAPAARQAKASYRHTKDQLWARIAVLEKALASAAKQAKDAARSCHNAGDTTNRDAFHAITTIVRGPREMRLVGFIRKDGSADGDAT